MKRGTEVRRSGEKGGGIFISSLLSLFTYLWFYLFLPISALTGKKQWILIQPDNNDNNHGNSKNNNDNNNDYSSSYGLYSDDYNCLQYNESDVYLNDCCGQDVSRHIISVNGSNDMSNSRCKNDNDGINHDNNGGNSSGNSYDSNSSSNNNNNGNNDNISKCEENNMNNLKNGNNKKKKDNKEINLLYWFTYLLPKIIENNNKKRGKNKKQMFSFIQHVGETVYVPKGWKHAVINLEISVAITHNFVCMHDKEMFFKAFQSCLSEMDISHEEYLECCEIINENNNENIDVNTGIKIDTFNEKKNL